MLTYLIVGAAVACLLAPLSWRLARGPKRIAIWALAVAVASLLFFGLTAPASLGAEEWYDRGPWRNLLLYCVMLIGMLTSVLTTAIAERKARIGNAKSDAERHGVRLQLDPYDLLYPFLLSLLTFGVLLGQVGDRLLSLVTLTLAYQTGFFWDSIITKLRSRVA